MSDSNIRITIKAIDEFRAKIADAKGRHDELAKLLIPEYNKSQENARRLRHMAGVKPEKQTAKASAEFTNVILSKVPEPRHNGTFYYCPYRVEEQHGGGISVTTCGMKYHSYTGSRFRTEKAYRRHWRRYHDG